MKNENVDVLGPRAQRMPVVAKLKLAASQPRLEGGPHSQTIQPAAVSEVEKVQDNRDQTPDIDTLPPQSIEPQVEVDAQIQEPSTEETEVNAVRPPSTFSVSSPEHDTNVQTHRFRSPIPIQRLSSPPPPSPLPPLEDIERNGLHLRCSQSTIHGQTAIHTLTDNVYDLPLTPAATPPPLRERPHTNLTVTGGMLLRLTPPPTPSPQTQHHPDILPSTRASFSAIPSPLLTLEKQNTGQDQPASARWRGVVIEEEDDEDNEEEVLYPTRTSHLRSILPCTRASSSTIPSPLLALEKQNTGQDRPALARWRGVVIEEEDDEDNEEEVLYPTRTSHLRSRYSYIREVSWIAPQEIRLPIDDDVINRQKDNEFNIEDRAPSSTPVSYLQDTYVSFSRAPSNLRHSVVIESGIPSDTTSFQNPPPLPPVAVLSTSLAGTSDEPLSSRSLSFPLSVVASPAQEDQTTLITNLVGLASRLVDIDASKRNGGVTTSTNTSGKITSFISPRSSSHLQSSKSGLREAWDRTDSSISHGCGASLDIGRTDKCDGSTTIAPQSKITQSLSASVPSLMPSSVSPVPLASGLDYPQYQSSKLFPFGLRKLEEERRLKGRICGSSSLPDVSILCSGIEGEQLPRPAKYLDILPGVEHRIGHKTPDTTMQNQYLNSSATASLFSQQGDSNISSTGSSSSKLPTVRKWPNTRTDTLFGMGYTGTIPVSSTDVVEDEAIVGALLDVNREPGPWHIIDATTDELAKKVATVLAKSEIYDQLSDLPVIQAQCTLDFLQDLLDIRGLPLSYKRTFLKASLELSRVHDCVPRCLTIGGFKKTGDYPFARGHYGDLWRGEVKGMEVTIKQGRILTNESNIKKVARIMTREAIIWGQCDHPNVLPFYGIYRDSATSSYSLVSPFMANGPLRQYLRNIANPDRRRLALDVTRGMDYLHKMSIVHGNLEGDNILISDDHRAVIADFGISFVMGVTTSGTSSSSRKGGTVRWQPPEVLNGNPNSFSADVYSLACVYFEVFDGSMPWSGINDGTVTMNVVLRRKHPPRPKHLAETKFPDLWWELMVQCWAHEPSDRPTLQDLMESLHVAGDILPPPPKWDKSILARLRDPLIQGKLHIPSDLPPFFGTQSILFGKQSVLPTTASTCPPKVSSLSPSPRMEYGTSVHFASYSSEVGRNTRETNFSTHSSAGDEGRKDEAIVDALLDVYRQETGPRHVLDATTGKLAKQVVTALSKSDDQLSDVTAKEAQFTLDFLQDLLDIQGLPLSYKRTFLKTSLKLSRMHDCVPRCLALRAFKKTGDYPFAQGHYGDLWRGEVGGTEVAVKQGRIYTSENNIEKVLRIMTREAIIWGQCDHPNVLPFYGIYRDSATSSYSLVSPFMANGPLRQYLRNTADPDRRRLALDITRGMGYLHKLSIVHGDLKGDNILISDDHRAVIADFGISFVMGVTTSGTSSSSRKGGTVRWQPPEVLNGNPNSFSADVYSLACVYFEVFDGSMPWSGINDGTVIMNVIVSKMHLQCPKHLAETKFPDLWWELMVRCWAHEPSDRPTLQDLMESLQVTDVILPPPPKWDKSILARLRGHLGQGKLRVPSDLPSFLNVEGVSYLTDPSPNRVTPK